MSTSPITTSPTTTSPITSEAHSPTGIDAAGVVAKVRGAFDSGITRPASWRREQLGQLKRLMKENEDELIDTLRLDLGKPAAEAYASEIAFTNSEIRNILSNLDRWMRPRHVPLPLKFRPGSARIVPQPLGVALVIAPWNFPVQLLLLPIATAIGAGNAVVGKPSEIAPRSSSVLARLIPRYLDQRAITVVEGGVAETTELLEQRFDHIFYTGNGRVGRIVMAAAARHLTPVTLELGGKSPVIVDRRANLDVAARQIAFGRFANAGQACIAPDYVLVDKQVEGELVSKLVASVRSFFGDNPKMSADYGRVVNESHWRRLKDLIDAGGYDAVACGGEGDEAARYLAPTILTGVKPDAAIMQDEIFGPILPIIAVDSVSEAIDRVNAGDKPLALYVFSEAPDVVDEVLSSTSSGGACVNGTVLQVAVPDLPFGGVGGSGIGAYHGQRGFDTFSHLRSVLTRSTRFDPPIMYPPITALKARLMRRFL